MQPWRIERDPRTIAAVSHAGGAMLVDDA